MKKTRTVITERKEKYHRTDLRAEYEFAILQIEKIHYLDSLRAEYEMAIRQKVSRNWIKPDNTGENVECRVLAIQIPSGLVVDVNVLSCTGSSAMLPLSVKLTVRKASPLPLSKDTVLFDRELEFIFRPE